MFSTTLDVEKKYFLRTWFRWPGNASNYVFNHSRGEKNIFLRTWFWWSGSMRKCIKTRFEPLQTLKNNFSRTWFWWSGNASKHVFNHSRGEKNNFWRTWFWWSGSTHKCIKTRFLPLQTLKKVFFKDLILVFWKCIKTRF